MSHYDDKIDYSTYPGTITPRRFQLISTKLDDGAVYGCGVEMYCGVCFVERPEALGGEKMLGFASLADVQQAHHIRWIDPPFERGQRPAERVERNIMKKIPTLFLRNPENMKFVTHEVNPDAAWLFTSNAMPTVKKDGTNILVEIQDEVCVLIKKRRNPTREEKALGQEPGYVLAHRDDPSDKHIFAAVDATDFSIWLTGEWSCEALGPKIQGGIESDKPCLYPFSWCPEWIAEEIPLTYDGIRDYLEAHEIEGIVWHGQDEQGRMCKIKRRDFGLPWPVKR